MFNGIKRKYFQGRIIDNSTWCKKVESICKKWAKKTPTVSSTDKKNVFIQLLKKNRRASIQVWQTGSLILALTEQCDNKANLQALYSTSIKEFFTDEINDSDYGILCFALIDYNSDIAKKMVAYIEQNRDANDIIYYKSGFSEFAFVDTLGFVCPFLTKYGINSNSKSYIELAKKQIHNYLINGTEEHCGLPFHAYRLSDGTHMGICDWARGVAWLLIALMDSYLSLKKYGVNDEFYLQTIKKYADIICKLQKPSGAFSWQLFLKQDSDSSATAVFGWFFANCYGIFKKEEYLAAARRCRDYLVSVTFNDGTIDYCQGDTIAIGVYSRDFDKMPFAQAFALRMQNALERFD